MGGGTASAPVFSGPIPDISETENTGSHQYDLSTYFTGATSYSIAPAVETGWSFNTTTGELEIDTDVVGSFGPFVVTGTNLVGSDDSNGFSVEVVAADSQQTPAGRKRRKRYFVEIDGQTFDVESVAEAEVLLKRATELANEVAAQATERSVKRIRRGKKAKTPELPAIVSSPELESLVDSYRDDIEAVYRQIAVDAELRELLRLKMLEEDDEDAIFVLLH